MIQADDSFTAKILFWQDKSVPGEPLDASKEAQRLQQRTATGKAPAKMPSPQIYRGEKSWFDKDWLGGIF